MIIADHLEYNPHTILDQGQTNACVTYSFFSVLMEYVEQEWDLKLEFDYQMYHEKVMKRLKISDKAEVIKNDLIFKIASEEGVVDLSGKYKIHVTTYTKKPDVMFNERWLMRWIQQWGCLQVAVGLYEGLDLNPKGYLIEADEDLGKSTGSHAIVLAGFKKHSRLFKVVNSWGKEVKWIHGSDLMRIIKNCYFINYARISKQQ